MNIVVLKYGGSSQTLDTYNLIYERMKIKSNKHIIVLSAIKGITNKLIDFISTKNFNIWTEVLIQNNNFSINCINEKTSFNVAMENKLWDLEKDKIEIIAMGEFFTTHILNNFLQKKGIKSKFLSSFDIIKSNQKNIGIYNKGEFVANSEILLNEFKNNDVLIVPGFSGVSIDNEPCLLGRGGSDTTGSIIASSINAKCYEIWTDVDGIYSSDPRFIKNTKIINYINYNAAQEIAAMGAKVIHPYSILPCMNNKIPILIKNSFNPDSLNLTTIGNYIKIKDDIYAITIQNDIKVFKITSQNMWNNFGFVFDIFSIFKKYNVDINIINTSQFNITTTTDDCHIENLLEIKNELSKQYEVELIIDNSIVSVISQEIRKYKNIGKIFEIAQNYNIILTSYSSNDMTLSWVINSNKSIDFAQNLHNYIF